MSTYLITFTCYGNWLHGDERGSVDLSHNVPGTPLVASDKNRVKSIQSKMKHEAIRFNEKQRELVDQAIRGVCEYKNWELLAINVRTNHVHVVVEANETPETAMNYFKRYASRHLFEAGQFTKETTIWTRHGSTRYLNNQKSIDAAIVYVLEGQTNHER